MIIAKPRNTLTLSFPRFPFCFLSLTSVTKCNGTLVYSKQKKKGYVVCLSWKRKRNAWFSLLLREGVYVHSDSHCLESFCFHVSVSVCYFSFILSLQMPDKLASFHFCFLLFRSYLVQHVTHHHAQLAPD